MCFTLRDGPAIAQWLRTLSANGGGYRERTDEAKATLQSSLSVVKTLELLGQPLTEVAQLGMFIDACRDPTSGGYRDQTDAPPTAGATAVALILLHALGEVHEDVWSPAFIFAGSSAQTLPEHFMIVAAREECALPIPVPKRTLDTLYATRKEALARGDLLHAAMADAALRRAGVPVPEGEGLVRALLDAQSDGGWGQQRPDLFFTYVVMRTLSLAKCSPRRLELLRYLGTLAAGPGFAPRTGDAATAAATYQVVCLHDWLRRAQRVAVEAARDGDIDLLQRWLRDDGEPNVPDMEGWTPLLAAASRGQATVVELLLDPKHPGARVADPDIRLASADALPIYLAGQNGDLPTVQRLLERRPEHLHAISRVNGHTVLLQAAFFGKTKHVELVRYLLDHVLEILHLPSDNVRRGVEQLRLTTATNVRGYTALRMNTELWHNVAMANVLRRYPQPSPIERDLYHDRLLLQLATPQALTEKVLAEIEQGLSGMAQRAARPLQEQSAWREESLGRLDRLLRQPQFEPNRLGGPLQQPPLVFAITGVDADPRAASLRLEIVERLLDAGADPEIAEKHPMAIGAVIRASVLNQFDILQCLATRMEPRTFADAINLSPAVNGLTALHDSVHRALTAPADRLERHLAQIRFLQKRGANPNLPDHTGQTQLQLAEAARSDPAFPAANVAAVLDALTTSPP